MIVLGIDPGLSLTGWGIVEVKNNKTIPIKYGCIRTKPSQTLINRLQSINSQLQKIIDEYRPSNAAIEELFFLKEAKTVAAVGQARGAIVLTIALNRIELFEYNPRRIKIALTGYGSADKYQMQRMVKTLLSLKEIPQPDDAADALAVAVCHINSNKWS
ncbi:MAG: crossover junction endodeoxyribonuclease RuvC [Rickettsiales bacterium]|nr:crossover junction endodeoxyribonuclease RuvC [Rickettsiales bacterium]